MKKTILSGLALLTVFIFVQCKSGSLSSKEKAFVNDAKPYMAMITEADLKSKLTTFSSEEFEGRGTGEPGMVKAANYIVDYYKKIGIKPPASLPNYFQNVPGEYYSKAKKRNASDNILGFIEGSEKPNEVLIISAHYDHDGIKNGVIYPGADDNGSGSIAVLELAKAFAKASKDGNRPKRSILFLHVTAEEIGLQGSRYYSENPIIPIENSIANINIDMIGRRGKGKENDNNYVYLIGADRLSKDLHNIAEQAREKYSPMQVDFTFNDPKDPNRFYFRSDHYNFAKKNIPSMFYFSGVHDDYHTVNDTADRIDYPLFLARTQLIFAVAWELANAPERPKLDK
jgi:Zn-dependent M28 family amino/carboxypeptidase